MSGLSTIGNLILADSASGFIYAPATYDSGANLANGSEQHPSDTGYRFLRSGGQWLWAGLAAGTIATTADITAFTPGGDEVVTNAAVLDTTSGLVWQWDGSAWTIPSSSELRALAGDVTGAQLYNFSALTLQQGTAGMTAINGNALRANLAAGEYWLATVRLLTGSEMADNVDLISAYLAGSFNVVSVGTDTRAGFGLILSDGTVDFTTGTWVGGGLATTSGNIAGCAVEGAVFSGAGDGLQTLTTDDGVQVTSFQSNPVGTGDRLDATLEIRQRDGTDMLINPRISRVETGGNFNSDALQLAVTAGYTTLDLYMFAWARTGACVVDFDHIKASAVVNS